MSIKTAAISALILILFLVADHVTAEIINIEYPRDDIYMEYGMVSVAVRVPEEFDGSVFVRVGDDEEESREISSKGVMRCFTAEIEPGLNTIFIYAEKDGKRIEEKSLTVFRRSDLINSARVPPVGFKRSDFHGRKEIMCGVCHRMEPSEGDFSQVDPSSFSRSDLQERALESESSCRSCHKNLMNYPYVHGPASVWSCLRCHQAETVPPYLVKKPDTVLCFGCHTEQKLEWTAKKYVHGPVNIGKCTICHSPHASDNPYNLFKSTWDLCVNCHSEKASGRHVLGDSFSSEGHPTHDRQDPLRPGKELSCASCHNPHASNQPHLWAYEVDSLFDLCQKCHRKKLSR
jgi:predicted CXXCH cytochrome family protein